MTTPTLGKFWNGYSWKVMPERIASVAEVLPARPRKTDREPKIHEHTVHVLSRGAVAYTDGIDQPSDLETSAQLDTAAAPEHPPRMSEFHTDPLPCAECAKTAPALCSKHAADAKRRADRSNDETPPSSPRPMREG